MSEDFLHYCWKYSLLGPGDFYTLSGDPVHIIHPGMHNTHAGPDFSDARIRIGETLWAGHVEIDLRGSDWYHHSHHCNGAYRNTILHVVYEWDRDGLCTDASIPVLVIQPFINMRKWLRYHDMCKSKRWMACEEQIGEVDSLVTGSWLDRLLIERLESKVEAVTGMLLLCNNSWEEAFYRSLARAFGFSVNTAPFEMLAASLPFAVLLRQRDNPVHLEALLFGEAGFLEGTFSESYPSHLKNEYRHLRKKFNLVPMDSHLWRFLRLRPVNFPTVRLAQLAALIHKGGSMFSRILEFQTIGELADLFTVSASSYWNNHYRFGMEAPATVKTLGIASVQSIIINTVVPFLFAYGKSYSDRSFYDRAVRMVEALPPEHNSIISGWKENGIEAASAAQSQALLQLRTHYCVRKKCLNCGIGNAILKM